MPTDDLLQFPDGGRATLVRQYSPPLTQLQFVILYSCPYEHPNRILPRNLRTARTLVRWKLLEEDPNARGVFRVTNAGAEVVLLWKHAGWAS